VQSRPETEKNRIPDRRHFLERDLDVRSIIIWKEGVARGHHNLSAYTMHELLQAVLIRLEH